MPQRDNKFNFKITLNIGECIHLLIKDYSHFLSSWVTECIYYLLLHKNYPSLKQQICLTPFLRVRNQRVANLDGSVSGSLSWGCTWDLGRGVQSSECLPACFQGGSLTWLLAGGLSSSPPGPLEKLLKRPHNHSGCPPGASDQEQGKSHSVFYYWSQRHVPSLLSYSIH